jgi:hypothetical protein
MRDWRWIRSLRFTTALWLCVQVAACDEPTKPIGGVFVLWGIVTDAEGERVPQSRVEVRHHWPECSSPPGGLYSARTDERGFWSLAFHVVVEQRGCLMLTALPPVGSGLDSASVVYPGPFAPARASPPYDSLRIDITVPRLAPAQTR